MMISLCITVFNEEKSIERLLESILIQTKKPDEVIIVDGGSSDGTVERIKNYESQIKNLKVIIKEGNRPFGRNQSIREARGKVIAITDAGCELDKDWLKELTKPFEDPRTEVVSGYYAGKPKNVFQASLVPYVLVMPDRVNLSAFLPSTRSTAMRKRVWEKFGGFPQEYRWNEDYVFSKRLEKEKVDIVFAKKAIVYWFPRENIIDGWKMFYAFAKGDAQAGIWRKKVLFLLTRVFLAIALFLFAGVSKSMTALLIFTLVCLLYFTWAIIKNYRYVKNPWAILFLPLWQIVSDKAVFIGTIVGFFDRLRKAHE